MRRRLYPIGSAYVAAGTKMPSGKAKSFSEKGWLVGQAEKEFRDKTAAWNRKWLLDRIG